MQVLMLRLKWIWCRNSQAFVWVEVDILLGRRLFQSVTIAFCWSGFETCLDEWGTQCERGTNPSTSAFFVPLIYVGAFKNALISLHNVFFFLRGNNESRNAVLGNKQCLFIIFMTWHLNSKQNLFSFCSLADYLPFFVNLYKWKELNNFYHS